MLGGELDGISIVDVATIMRWGNTYSSTHSRAASASDTVPYHSSPFPYCQDINMRIAYWMGDVSMLNSHAIVCCNNELLNDNDRSTQKVLRRAGPELTRDLIDNIKSCKTGEVKITKAYRLPSRYILHTVGPKYSSKYKTAAESALFSCYRNVLTTLQENRLRSVGLRCIHSVRRGYPVLDGSHIALRTVRRFLEKTPVADVELIIFVITTAEEKEAYNALLPLYFPRSTDEELFAVEHLPADVGNEWGEPVIAERSIRISANPAKFDDCSSPDDDDDDGLREMLNSSCSIGQHAFSRMEVNVDSVRQQQRGAGSRDHSHAHRPHSHVVSDNRTSSVKQNYERLLDRSRHEDFSELHSKRFLYQSGFDRNGRAVIIFIARNFPADRLTRQKEILYFIHQLDCVVSSKYVIVYVHSLVESRNELSVDCLTHLMRTLHPRYIDNLETLFMLHTSMWTKMSFWWLTRFNCVELKEKIVYLGGLEYLFAHIPLDQLDLPQFVVEHDYKINGIRYYNEPEAIFPAEQQLSSEQSATEL